jgi:hypothetical protein
MPNTIIRSEIWDDKNKDFNKVKAAEIELITSLHRCTEI